MNEKKGKNQEEILDYKAKYGKNNSTNLEKDILSNNDKIKEFDYKNAEMCVNLEYFERIIFCKGKKIRSLKIN